MPPRKKTEKVSKKSGKDKEVKVEETDEIVGDLSPADALLRQGVVTTYALSNKKIHPNVRDIVVSNLTVTYQGSPLLEETELTLNYGNRYGYLGRNGCGKSTFMKVIAARSFPMAEGIDIYHVSHEIEATDLTAKEAVMAVDSERQKLEDEADKLNDLVAEQEGTEEAELALDRLNQIYERLEELDSSTAETRASKILTGLGFSPERQNKKTKEFSGGWRMRIALARALFIQPTLLLLDEPTNHLDMEAVVWLEEYLANWKKILFMVSHSQDFLNGVCTHIIHHTRKKLVYYSGNYDQFVKTRQEKEEEQEKRYKSEQDQIKHMKNYVAKFGQGNAKMAKQAQSKEKVLDKMLRSGLTEKVEHEKKLDFSFPDPQPLSPPVLQCTDITFGYPGQEILYSNVDFGVDLDSRIALVGPNGAGKSTLLKIITGELLPVGGAVRPHAHLRFSKFSQHFIDALDLSLSPLDYFVQTWPDMTREDSRKFLGRFGISGNVQTQVMNQLSDGQKSRVVFAKIAKEAPHLLLLDEPTNHLDMESIDSLAKAINNFKGGMMLVSHDMRLISQVAKEIWLCDNKTVSKYVGEIGDFKMQLRKQVLSDGTEAVKKPPVVPLRAKGISLASDVVPEIAPLIAPPLPSVDKEKEKQLEKERKEKEKKEKKEKSEVDLNEDELEKKRLKEEEKAAKKAARKAEKEAAEAYARKEEEERNRRKEEKLRDAEEARILAEKLEKEREEWRKRKEAKDALLKAEEEAIAAQLAERQRRIHEAKLLKRRERIIKSLRLQEQERLLFNSACREDIWTQEQQDQLEAALLQYSPFLDKFERWTSISNCVDGKSKQQCLARYKYLKNYFIETD